MSQASSSTARRIHPGAGRRKALHAPRGRNTEPQARQEIQTLLGNTAPERALLIEYLHRIQDAHGQLENRHLVALAELLRIPMAEVYEVASFYAHFEIVEDGESAPALTLRVCDSLTCEMNGSAALLETLQRDAPETVRVVRAPCMGRCADAPVVAYGHENCPAGKAEEVLQKASALARNNNSGEANHSNSHDAQHSNGVHGVHHVAAPAEAQDFAAYESAGGYNLLRACLQGKHTAEAMIARLSDSGLRGLGGAGFPAGRKWQAVRDAANKHGLSPLLTINADEGEPGTFKDRYCLSETPHRMLEGALIAAWAVGCESGYIYLRDEYPELHSLLARELAEIRKAGLDKHCPLVVRRGAGAYICGEESAMLESIEGKRGLPRHRPPFIAEVGLWGKPTLNHNVETLWWLPEILEQPDGWFASHGRRERTGLRLFSVSGRVAEPGVKRAPAGISLTELIAEFCGGMARGHKLRGYLPGGASGGILPASLADLPLDFDTLQPHGCFIGSGAIVVLSDQDDLRAAVRNLMRFFEDESCGQCTPCRNGTEKISQLLLRDDWNKELLEDLATVMADASICGLGQAAANPVLSLYRHFPEEFN